MPRGSNSWGIYIGNIPHLLTKEHIEGLFEKFNIVEASDIHCNGTKTFCFMKLREDSDVTNAVTEMNNHCVNGRKLQVRRFENKSNGDAKSSSSSMTIKDVPPPLETPVINQNNFGTHSYQKPSYSNNKFRASGYGHQNSSDPRQTSCAPPLPPGYNNNPTHNNFHKTSRAQNSGFSSNHNQLDEASIASPNKRNSLHSPPHHRLEFSPRGKNTHPKSADQWKEPPSPNKSTSSQHSVRALSDRIPQSSAVDYQSSHELPEKYRYVHCTRNVISYNPRDLENNKIRFKSCEHSSSEAVKVWVANFPFGTTKVQMTKLFEDFSPLKVYVNNNAPGRDFTRATITLPSLDAAEAAIMELDNTIYKRRTLLVGLVEEGDEFADDDDDEDYDGEEEYGDVVDYYYKPYCDYSKQDYYHRSPNDEQFYYEEPISRRFNDVHLS